MDEGSWAYVGWYGVEWQGQRLELALTPTYLNGPIACMGADEQAVAEEPESPVTKLRRGKRKG